MIFCFTRELQPELAEVDQVFKEGLLPWWSDVHHYVNRLESNPTWHNFPAIVLSMYKYMGLEHKCCINMTNIFKTLYFANSIHATISDEEEGQKYDQELQFSILIGDYIFGHILKILVDVGADKLLQHFSALICELNEGLIMKHKMGADYRKVMETTRAPLYAYAFLTAAELKGTVYDEKLKLFKHMGHQMGMLVELIQDHERINLAGEYIHNAIDELGCLENLSDNSDTILEKVVVELHNFFCSEHRVAVM